MAEPLTDLTVTLEDRPGTLATAASALGKAGVNIEGICGFSTEGDKAVGHILVQDAGKARRALEGAGTQVRSEHPVIVLEIPDRPGELGKVAQKSPTLGSTSPPSTSPQTPASSSGRITWRRPRRPSGRPQPRAASKPNCWASTRAAAARVAMKAIPRASPPRPCSG